MWVSWYQFLFFTVSKVYHTLRSLSRGFTNFFSERPLWDLNPSAWQPAFNLVGTHPLTFLLYHIFCGLSRGFSNFFEKSFRLALSHSYQCLVVCGLLPSPLDIAMIPHPKAKYNSQSIQNGIKNFIYFCTVFPLDNCWADVV